MSRDKEIVLAEVSVMTPNWRHVWLKDPDLHLLVCAQERHGRSVITHMIVSGVELDSAAVDSIPMGQIIQLMAIKPPAALPIEAPEAPPAGADLQDRIEHAARVRAMGEEMESEEVLMATESVFSRLERFSLIESISGIPGLVPRLAPEARPWTVALGRERLKAPDRGPGYDPDVFYRQVGDAYATHMLRTSRIAPAIAEEAGVPVTTARGWIREARKRGFIEPKKRSRA